MEFDPQIILQILARSRRPLTGREVASRLELSSRQSQQVYRLLDELARHGEVKRQRGGRYSLPRDRKTVRGRLQVLRSGAGLVTPEGGGRDILVPQPALAGALPGDLVEVLPANRGRDGRLQGRVLRVIEGGAATFVGIFRSARHGGMVYPVDSSLPAPITVAEPLPAGLQSGQVVVMRGGSGKGELRQQAVITEILGFEADPLVEVLAVAHRFGLPTVFPAVVRQAAAALPQQVAVETVADRCDLRHLPFVTIDGETAKDFDDAVALRPEPDGNWRLWVAIADVDHYVDADGVLDRAALERGTSVYFPGTCLPMLPEELSNGICSLNPQVDRLVMVAEMLFSAAGERLSSRFCRAVICSRARLTYTGVQQYIDDEASPVPAPHLEQLRPMSSLAAMLTQMRRKRGSLDLDLPEAEVLLDDNGHPVGIRRGQRLQAHRLIEEFMLAANEAVATALADAGLPVVYRIHEPPQGHDLDAFLLYARHLGVPTPHRNDSLIIGLQRMLAAAPDDATRHLLHRQLLRSLKQARYDLVNRGHFGLAAEYYCHFTSPIRRYPDLAVHRLLKALIDKVPPSAFDRGRLRRLQQIAEASSQAERRAVEAERDMTALKCCQVMQNYVGETFAGHVSSVHPFGFFVELDEIFVEGLVHVSTLGDDYYHYDEERFRLIGERRQRVFAPGTPVEVKVLRADVVRREIDLVLAGGEAPLPPGRRARVRRQV